MNINVIEIDEIEIVIESQVKDVCVMACGGCGSSSNDNTIIM